MNSHNHPMFGSIGTYFYEFLAGIDRAANAPGYTRLRIAPNVVRDLQYASGSIETIRGAAASNWMRDGDTLRLQVTVPFGSTAEVVLPNLNLRNATVTEGGKPVWSDGKYQAGDPGIVSAKEANGAVTLEVGSGTYNFERSGL
jgi:alpha-L-rhamnosidase